MSTPDSKGLKGHIRQYYSHLYQGKHSCSLPIRTGRDLAGDLGYPLELLKGIIPKTYWDWFVPCGNLLPFIRPSVGGRILNLGCGAAVDSFSILLQHGSGVRIANLDVVHSVLKIASALASHQTLRFEKLHWICGDGEHLPFRNGSFDWIIMNGVLNLFPEKLSLLGELHRALRAGGCLLVADLCCNGTLPGYFSEEPDAWAWCMSGACTPAELKSLLEQAGFGRIRIRVEECDDQFCRVIVTSVNEI